MVEVKKEHENESPSSLIFRFNKKVQQSGVLKEAKKRRFRNRTENKNRRRVSALNREKKRLAFEKMKKLGRA